MDVVVFFPFCFCRRICDTCDDFGQLDMTKSKISLGCHVSRRVGRKSQNYAVAEAILCCCWKLGSNMKFGCQVGIHAVGAVLVPGTSEAPSG